MAFASVEDILLSLPEDRKLIMEKLIAVFDQHLPQGFEKTISFGMIGYVVPHATYPAGYHCKPAEPLPFLSMASQKAAISIYHMGIYADPSVLDWFVQSYPLHCKTKLDMGKSCIRFKKLEDIPWDLLAQLAEKMTPTFWVELYESKFRR
jgi:hypothetical protein